MTHSSPDIALAERIADHVITLANTKMQMSLIIWDRMSRDFLEVVKLLRDCEPLYATPPQAALGVEECAKIAESHVGMWAGTGENDRNLGYDEACREIAKAIRDTFAGAPVFAGGGDGTFNEAEPDDDIVRAARALHTSQEQKP